ncbi:MAG: glycosyltransferase, partial [Terrimicrobiaceae bacterium]
MSDPGLETKHRLLFLSGHAHRALDPRSVSPSGGAELQVALLASELMKHGHAVTVLAASDGFSDGVVWKGVKIRDGGRFDTGRLTDTLKALGPVIRVLREEKPAHVVVYGWTTWLALLGVLSRFLGFHVIYVCALDSEIDGGFRAANPIRGRIFDRGLRTAAERFAITEHQAGMFRAKGLSCHVLRLLTQEERPPTPPKKSLDLLWVARCHPVKSPHLFLDLVEKLPGVTARMICSPQ